MYAILYQFSDMLKVFKREVYTSLFVIDYFCYMNVIKQFFNFYINSSIHVALSVFSLTWLTLLELHLDYNEAVLYFVFYGTITGYNFVKYFGMAKFRHRKLARWLKVIQMLSFICFLLMVYYAFYLQRQTFFYIVGLGGVTFLYAIPLSINKPYTLRNISGLKVFIIALVWTGVTVFLPAINAFNEINSVVLLTGIQRFIYVLVLMIPFEIRDLKYDNLELSTIPQKLGIKRTKILGFFLLLAVFLLELLKGRTSNYTNTIILLVLLAITFLFVLYSKIKQGRYYSSFFVEALPIIWLLLVLMFL